MRLRQMSTASYTTVATGDPTKKDQTLNTSCIECLATSLFLIVLAVFDDTISGHNVLGFRGFSPVVLVLTLPKHPLATVPGFL